MATSVSSPSPTASTSTAAADSARDLVKQIRSHEVAVAELNHLPSSRVLGDMCERIGGLSVVGGEEGLEAKEQGQVVRGMMKRAVHEATALWRFAVYQKNSNIFFRTTVQKATTFEQGQLDAAKAKLDKLNSP